MNLRPQRKISAEFSMSSMTDIIFLLLIFFIIASTFISPNAITVNLPAKDSKINKPITIAVAVTKDNTYYINNEETSVENLPSTLEAVLNKEIAKGKEKKDISIALYGDVEAQYQHVFNVVKVGKALDLQVLLATEYE